MLSSLVNCPTWNPNPHPNPNANPSPHPNLNPAPNQVKRPDSRGGVPAVVHLLCARLLAGDCAELKEVRIFRVPGDAAEVWPPTKH